MLTNAEAKFEARFRPLAVTKTPPAAMTSRIWLEGGRSTPPRRAPLIGGATRALLGDHAHLDRHALAAAAEDDAAQGH
ncbi:MAG: hypothetical protein ACXWJ1_08925, partial [Caldimonas sp.]